MRKAICTVLACIALPWMFAQGAPSSTEGSRRLLIYNFGGAVTNLWAEKKFTLFGFEDATWGALPFKYDNEGKKELRWLSNEEEDKEGLVILKKDTDPVVLNTPDGVTADKPKVLTFDGMTVEWGNGGEGVPVDDASITTNTAHGAVSSDTASIYGFSTAGEGDVPHKTSSGEIEWKAPSGGCALKFVGTDGGQIIVGSGSVTNSVRFASADDSNVKVKCESDDEGGVTVTIGVYYK